MIEELQMAIYLTSTALLIPVIILLFFLLSLTCVEAGRFIYEGIKRVGKKEGKNVEIGLVELKKIDEENEDIKKIAIERVLQEFEAMTTKKLIISRILTRIGPMFGLMGTLIPLGPALIALSGGDVATLANNLIIAFGTTVLGLVVAAVAFCIQIVKERWYDKDIRDMEYYAELMTTCKDIEKMSDLQKLMIVV